MQTADSGLTQLKEHKKLLRLMGNRFEITVVHEDAAWAAERIDEAVAEISRIEKLLTTFNEESQTALINRNAGIAPVKVDREVFDLVYRSLKISRLTQGAFDITYGSIDKSPPFPRLQTVQIIRAENYSWMKSTSSPAIITRMEIIPLLLVVSEQKSCPTLQTP